MGDLNAKVSADHTNLEQIMGKHGLGEENENGEMFVGFAVRKTTLTSMFT